MAEYTGYTQNAGILVHEERIKDANLRDNDGAAGNSSYTENGRRPGRGEYDRAETALVSTTAGDLGPSMSLETTGDQAAVDYHVKVLKGGMPGDECEVIYRPDLTSDSTWQGFNTHNVIEYLKVDDSIDTNTLTTNGEINFATVSTGDNQVLFVYMAASGGVNRVSVRKFNPEDHSLAAAVVVGDQSAAIGDDDSMFETFGDTFLVEAIRLPTDRILIYALTADIHIVSGTGNMTLWTFYSDDHGVTWRSGNYLAVDTLINATSNKPIKMRAVYSNESVLLVISQEITDDYGALQFASDDTGTNFRLVEDWQDAGVTEVRHHDMVVDAAGVITFLYYEENNTRIEYRRIANPFVPLSGAAATTLTTDNITHLAAYQDTDGTLYVTWDNVEDIEIAYSRDGGATWTQISTHVVDTGDVTDLIDLWEVEGCHGRAVWMISDTGSGMSGGAEFLIMESGGWSQLVEPRLAGTTPTENQGFGSDTNDGHTWFPFQSPQSYFWTRTGTADTTATLQPFGTRVNTAAATTYWNHVPTGAVVDGMEVFFSLTIASGGTVAATNIGLELFLDDGAKDWRIEVRFSTTQCRVYDVNAAATVDTQNVTMTSQKVFKVALRSITGGAAAGAVTVYVRDPADDNWTTLITDRTLTAAATAGANRIRWGTITSSTSDSKWHWFHYRMSTGKGEVGRWFDDLAMDTLSERPFVLYGKRLPAAPYRAWLDQDLYVHGTGGPSARGDTYKIVPSYDHPVGNLDIVASPSPSETWRSSGTAAVERVAWTPSSGQTTHFGSPTWGVVLLNCNFPTALLLGWTGAAYVTVGTVDLTGGMTGLTYVRTGDVIEPNTGAGATGVQWIGYDELVGHTVDLGSGKLRKVLHNTEGSWTQWTTKTPVLTLDGVDGTEPATGTMSIWYPDAYVLVHDNSNDYARFAVQIPAGATVDGYYQMGGVVMGAVAVFGHKYSSSRVIETVANADLFEASSGVRSSRSLGAERRIVEAAWIEGFDASEVQIASPLPNYIAAQTTGTTPVAARGDAYLLEGIMRRLQGPHKTCVYLPKIKTTSTDVSAYAGRRALVYGRLMESIRRETAGIGEENTSEVVRISGLRMTEEV